MANGLVNVEGITNKEVEELAQILNELNELIGSEANTGGTAMAGTVMAKLNRLLTDLTTTRAGYLDTINTNAARLTNERATKLDNIGATNNTGGTTTAGTVMAKLNKLLTDWTTARAGYLDTINTNIGATGNTGGTTTAGTIMAKLNKLLTDWTTARAGKIDTISTNAANLNSRLTSTRAGYLDLLNRGVGIKSVQRGLFWVDIKNGTPTQDDYSVTLSTIVPSKTFILTQGKMFTTSGTISEGKVANVGTTYFKYEPGFSGNASGSSTIRWQAIEFY